MKVFFVTIGLRDEIEVIRKVRPSNILCSYWYFAKKPMSAFVDTLGYQPEILLDSGAYSAFNQRKTINISEYIEYIQKNIEYIRRYISLDVIGDGESTKKNYMAMMECGLNPIPVVHYGDVNGDVEFYKQFGVDTIALGNTVRIKDKHIVANWCAELHENFPNIKFHLLGSCSKKILESNALASCDSSTWYMMAVNGKPKSIIGKTREDKRLRAEANMLNIMEVFNESPVSVDNCSVKHFDSQVQPICFV